MQGLGQTEVVAALNCRCRRLNLDTECGVGLKNNFVVAVTRRRRRLLRAGYTRGATAIAALARLARDEILRVGRPKEGPDRAQRTAELRERDALLRVDLQHLSEKIRARTRDGQDTAEVLRTPPEERREALVRGIRPRPQVAPRQHVCEYDAQRVHISLARAERLGVKQFPESLCKSKGKG